MFVSEYFGLGDELDKKEIFDCVGFGEKLFFNLSVSLKRILGRQVK